MMAVYEYNCPCGAEAVHLKPMAQADQPVRCKCGREMVRQFSTFALIKQHSAADWAHKAARGEATITGKTREESMAIANAQSKAIKQGGPKRRNVNRQTPPLKVYT